MDYSPSPSAESNHRKRRRNRMRVSCLNCYASKRKCDRKRPCARCIKHGLTGLCVYELDDPSARDDNVDETVHLRNRIAELESIIRELNNRPHPRWFARGGVAHNPDLIALRRAPKRRKASNHNNKDSRDGSPHPSVDEFFESTARDDEDDHRDTPFIKIEEQDDDDDDDATYAPTFASSSSSKTGVTSRRSGRFRTTHNSGCDSPLTPLSSVPPLSPPPSQVPHATDQSTEKNNKQTTTTPLTESNTSTASSSSSLGDLHHHHYGLCGGSGLPTPNKSLSSSSTTSFGSRHDHDPSPDPSSSSVPPLLHSPASSNSSEEGPPLALLYPYSDHHKDIVSNEIMVPNELGLSLHGQPPEPTRHLPPLNVGVQTSPPPPPSPSPSTPSKNYSVPCRCQCIRDPSVYNALVYFANALRTSREALDTLHHEAGNDPPHYCSFYKKVVELDEHVFSLSPPTPPRLGSIEIDEEQQPLEEEEEEDDGHGEVEDRYQHEMDLTTDVTTFNNSQQQHSLGVSEHQLGTIKLPRLVHDETSSRSPESFFSPCYDFSLPLANFSAASSAGATQAAEFSSPAYPPRFPTSPGVRAGSNIGPTPVSVHHYATAAGQYMPQSHSLTHSYHPPSPHRTPTLAPSSPSRVSRSAIRHEYAHRLPLYSAEFPPPSASSSSPPLQPQAWQVIGSMMEMIDLPLLSQKEQEVEEEDDRDMFRLKAWLM